MSQSLRVYGQQSAVDTLVSEIPSVVATPDAACADHPGEFLGSIEYPDDDNEAVNQRFPLLGLSCDDFPSW